MPADDITRRRAVQKAVPTIGILLVPGFSLMAYASAVEPLRAANRLAYRELYGWRHFSIDGEPVQASNGATILCEHRIGDKVKLDLLLVCAGGNPALFEDEATLTWLRALARRRRQDRRRLGRTLPPRPRRASRRLPLHPPLGAHSGARRGVPGPCRLEHLV